jgi:hypothetical protein
LEKDKFSKETGEITMPLFRLLIITGLIFALAGCSTDKTQQAESPDQIELTKINTNQTVDQRPANTAKNILANYDDITAVKAANTSETLLIAIEIKHSRRFSLQKTEKALQKKMKKEFPDMDVVFSTDKKINMELEQIEQDMKANKLSGQTLKKRIEHLISLSKEET